jgi:mannose-6-phosphate isomerase
MSMHQYMVWFCDEALPFWIDHACDQDGLFWEVLDLDGTPRVGADLRLRTGMRQVYVMAHAAALDLAPRDRCVTKAVEMLERLRRVAWAPKGRPGWVARFDRDGRVLDPRHDLYDHAFVLNALGYVHQMTGDDRYLVWIDETLRVIEEGMAGRHGGWAESTFGELPRRQNPHMHFFEANLSLFETTGDPRHLARAGELFGLFRSRFLDQETGVLREFFGPAWQVSAEYGSERLDPGHMMEWVWLLRRFQRLTGRAVDGLCASLLATAAQIGQHESGFLVDEVDSSGTPLSDSRRLWPQTEYIKAYVVQAIATKRFDLLPKADAMAERLRRVYLSECPPGCWRDQFTLAGRPTATTIPASTLYHLMALAAEVRILQLHG